MRKTLMATGFACLTLAFMAWSAVAAQPQKTAVLTGTWQCMSHGGENGDLAFTLTLQQHGQSVTGHVSSSIGDADLSASTYKAGHLHIVIAGDDNTYVLEANYQDGQLKGTWSASGSQTKGTWEGKKAAASKQ